MSKAIYIVRKLFTKVKPEVKIELHKENLTNLLWLNYIILAISVIYLIIDIINYNLGVWDNFASQYTTYILHSVTCLVAIILIILVSEFGLNQRNYTIERFNIVIAITIITYLPFLGAFNYLELRDHNTTGFITMFFFIIAAILRVNLSTTLIITFLSSVIYFYMLHIFGLNIHNSPVHYFNGASIVFFSIFISRFLSVREILNIETKLLLSVKNIELEKAQEQIKDQNIFLTESNASFKNFAAIAAHDLKSPLRTIGSFTEIIYNKNKEKYTIKDIELSNFIIDNSKSLQVLVDDILTFSDINESLPNKQVFDLSLLIEDVIQSIKVSILENNVRINVESEENYQLEGHPSLFKQLLLNLISNSIKYKDAQKEAFVKIKVSKTKDNISINIEDNGIGISSKKIHKIFIPFMKLHEKNYQGSGLGLSTCKKIVDFYNGTITVSSELGIGTKITLMFPNDIIK